MYSKRGMGMATSNKAFSLEDALQLVAGFFTDKNVEDRHVNLVHFLHG